MEAPILLLFEHYKIVNVSFFDMEEANHRLIVGISPFL